MTDWAAIAAYNQNPYKHDQLVLPLRIPLSPAPHIAVWEEYAGEAATIGVFAALQKRLVQFWFPIEAGISADASYRTATRKGVPPEELPPVAGLALKQPEKLRLFIHQSIGGKVPVIVPAGREDFETVLRAVVMRNEPQPVAASQGAAMVLGYNNWDRIARLRCEWENANPGGAGSWAEEFARIIPRKELYQDKFIILSDGPYSGIDAREMGLDADAWLRLSLVLRLEHECSHYFTYRLLSPTAKSLLDEIIADYTAIVAANGCFRADWFLHFWGLAAFPAYSGSGRLGLYCDEAGIAPEAFHLLKSLICQAAANLQTFSENCRARNRQETVAQVLALTQMTLSQLANAGCPHFLEQAADELRPGIIVDL
jgi:hypothetical protein